MAYRVKNWDQYQHYKDRNPPWIKLHFSILSSEDWIMLDDKSRVLAIACMLIASRNNGEIPDNLEYIRRVAYLKSTPSLKSLIDSGFLVNTSGCKHMLADARPEERREETEKTPLPPNIGGFDEFWKKYPKKTGKGAARKIWSRLRPDAALCLKILCAVAAQSQTEQWTKEGGRFIPNPATWLNQERWDDEIKREIEKVVI